MSDRGVISSGDAWKVTVEQHESNADPSVATMTRLPDGEAYAVAHTPGEAADIIDRIWSAPNGGFHRIIKVEFLGVLWRDNSG